MIDEKKLIEEMAEEIENFCGRKTNLTKKARKLLELKEFGDWIPCNERLPECKNKEEVPCLFHLFTGRMECGYFGIGGRYRDKYFRTHTDATDGWDITDVIAWQPLPEPYKESEG